MTNTRRVAWLMVTWLATRALTLGLLAFAYPWVAGDVHYYASSLGDVSVTGWSGTLVEYPLPAVLVLAVPWGLAELVGDAPAYPVLLTAVLLVVDAVFTVLLARRADSEHRWAVGVWLAAVPLLGATTYARFDLLPGVLVACALLFVRSRPRLGAGSAAVATALKLWPVVLLPLVFVWTRRRLHALGAVALVGGLAVLATLAVGGWQRLLSPLTWQSDRGLQVESVAASPAILGWAIDPGTYVVFKSRFHAYEVLGPGVHALSVLTDLATATGFLLVAALFGLAWRRRTTLSWDALVWLALSAVLVPVVASKVLSPQYLLWILPVAAAAGALIRDPEESRRLRLWCWVLLVATACTHVVFPMSYGQLVFHESLVLLIAVILVVRNVLLVWMLQLALRRAWAHLSPASGTVPVDAPVATAPH